MRFDSTVRYDHCTNLRFTEAISARRARQPRSLNLQVEMYTKANTLPCSHVKDAIYYSFQRLAETTNPARVRVLL